jgi:hypothetical protein
VAPGDGVGSVVSVLTPMSWSRTCVILAVSVAVPISLTDAGVKDVL